jgi:hypothetical protein
MSRELPIGFIGITTPSIRFVVFQGLQGINAAYGQSGPGGAVRVRLVLTHMRVMALVRKSELSAFAKNIRANLGDRDESKVYRLSLTRERCKQCVLEYWKSNGDNASDSRLICG